MKTYVLLFLLFMSFSATIAQKKEAIINDLKEKIKTAETDSIRVQLEFDLVDIIGQEKDIKAREDAIVLIEDILNTLEKNKWNSSHYQHIKVESLQNMATFKIESENLLEALQWQQKALDYSTLIKDSLAMGVGYWGLGNINETRLDTLRTKQNFQKSVQILERIHTPEGKTFLAQSLSNLGGYYANQNKGDSARIFFKQAQKLNIPYFKSSLIHNIGLSYLNEEKYENAVAYYRESLRLKEDNAYTSLSGTYRQLGVAYRGLKQYNKALEAVDSAFYYNKLASPNRQPLDMQRLYNIKINLLQKAGQYDKLYKNFIIYTQYLDTINNISEANRVTELTLNYEFDKEREIAAIQLENANSKKRLYIILFITALTLGFSVIYVVVKNKKQKVALARNEVALEQMEKMKAKLALANRESELKKILVESSITEEVLNKTLDDIKEIITKQDIAQRDKELRSLSTSLLAEKSNQRAVASLQEHIDEVSIDFKVYLDKQYPMLKLKDKELLYLMKAGLNTKEISKLLKTTLASVKSKRYRMRKKLNLGSDVDIVAHLEKEMVTS